jgi:radical SAM superfamily enzyme YgiQ (UPF0313 family)
MIYPEIPSTYWSYRYVMSFIDKKSTFPPLGLLTVASLLPEDWEVRLVDLNVRKLEEKDLEWADAAFLSAMIVQQKSFKETIGRCREAGIVVVAGGPYPTTSREKIEGVDHFVLNEAEVTLPQFIRDYERGVAKGVYEDETKPSLDQTPVPRFDLVHHDDYVSMCLQFSRGCPYNCEFCDIIEMFGRVPRTKQPGCFINELEALYDSGFRGGVFVVDDNFIGHRRKVHDLLRHVARWQKERNYPFRLYTEASINLAEDEDLMDLMVESGFDMVFIGIETPDSDTLAAAHKLQNTRLNILESVERIQKRGIEVTAGFIVGFDSDDSTIFQRQLEFIQEAAIPVAMVGLLVALPRTQFARRLKEEGRLLDGLRGNNTHDLELNFIPVMDKSELVQGYRDLLKRIYDPKLYFQRCLKLLKRLPAKNSLPYTLTLRDLRALFSSLIRQTFSSHGFEYLKFVYNTIRRFPKRFPLAIGFAVKGYHFFHITDDIIKADGFRRSIARSILDFEERVRRTIDKKGRPLWNDLVSLERKLAITISWKYQFLNRFVQEQVNDSVQIADKYRKLLMNYWQKNFNLLKKGHAALFPDNLDRLLEQIPGMEKKCLDS